MKKTKKNKWKSRLQIFLLCILFIGGAELCACYWLDPAIFDKITTPVLQAASSLWNSSIEFFSDAKTNLAQRIETIGTQEEPEEIESQKAGTPLLQGDGIPIQDPTITELVIRDGQEVLTGGALPIAYFAQSDPAWKDQTYGTDNIGDYGCGPTAMAMAAKSTVGADVTPASMAQWCSQYGYWAAGSGSYHTIVQGVASGFGMTCSSPKELSVDELRTRLSSGEIAVALMKAGHFTDSGHFILLRGTTLNGNILVADPNSRERSLQEWDPQLIVNELSNSRTAGAPLWFLSGQSGA